MEAATRGAREKLHQFLAAKTRPDLEHVMTSVLETFDEKVTERRSEVIFENKQAATSANRELRMAITLTYREFIKERSNDTAMPPHARFAAISTRYDELIVQFIGRCVGGSLAWPHFVKLQEMTRMEQLDAREKILREDVLAGKPLPPIAELLKDAAALVAVLGPRAAPAWLQSLAA